MNATHTVKFLVAAGCKTLPDAAPRVQHADANGVRLAYVEQGRGTPVVFVHGSLSDWRSWEAQRADFARQHRYIAYTRRYFGTDAWPDDGRNYSPPTDAADLAAFIGALNTGPAHIVAWSSGGAVATLLALEHPQLVRSLTIHEPVLPPLIADAPAGRQALADMGKGMAPVAEAAKTGDHALAARRFWELVMELPAGGFDGYTAAPLGVVLDNARTLPLHLAAPRPEVSCAQLGLIKAPTLVTRGADSMPFFALMSETFARCVPGSRLVVIANSKHDSPQRVPRAFNDTVLEFLNGR